MGGFRATKQSVALAVAKGDDPSKVLLVRRPEGDRELPGAWGLPAASLLQEETPEAAARRIGVQKLGAEVRVGRRLGSARQDRAGYILEMSLYGAVLERGPLVLPTGRGGDPGVTLYTAWRWGDPLELADSAGRGSLCSRLLLDSLGL
jgi:ADP-ribose pyrophosphatase YjhB (NUDIX family)